MASGTVRGAGSPSGLTPSWSCETSPACPHGPTESPAPSRAKSLVSPASYTTGHILLPGQPLGYHTTHTLQSFFCFSALLLGQPDLYKPGTWLLFSILTLILRNLVPLSDRPTICKFLLSAFELQASTAIYLRLHSRRLNLTVPPAKSLIDAPTSLVNASTTQLVP